MGKAFSPLCLVLSLAFPGSSNAEDPSFEPFRFKDGARRFTESVRFPDVAGDVELELRCAAWFDRGRTQIIRCDGAQRFEAFHHAVLRAGPRFLRGTRAKLGERSIAVNVPFRVRFRQKAGAQSVAVFPNHGESAETHGEGYLGPQQVNAKRSAGRFLHCNWGVDLGFAIHTEAKVGPPVKVVPIDGKPREICARSVKGVMMTKTYLPGMVGDEPIATARTFRLSEDIEGWSPAFARGISRSKGNRPRQWPRRPPQ